MAGADETEAVAGDGHFKVHPCATPVVVAVARADISMRRSGLNCVIVYCETPPTFYLQVKSSRARPYTIRP